MGLHVHMRESENKRSFLKMQSVVSGAWRTEGRQHEPNWVGSEPDKLEVAWMPHANMNRRDHTEVGRGSLRWESQGHCVQWCTMNIAQCRDFESSTLRVLQSANLLTTYGDTGHDK